MTDEPEENEKRSVNMMVEIAAMVTAIAFVVLVVYLVIMLVQIKKTAIESERLLRHLNSELPSVLKELRLAGEQVNALAIEARDGVEHASVFLHAVGEMGETVQRVHGLVRGQSGSVMSKVVSVIAGVKAASSVVKGRFSRGKSDANGAG
jgi:uncharacterized protein YoxC